MADNTTRSQPPAPDPALKRLDRFVGMWRLEGHLVGSNERNISGQAAYRWLPGGFFLEQRIKLDFMGLEIDSLELVGYYPETGTFPSTVFANLSPVPLPYRWDVGDDGELTIKVSYGPLDATFTGKLGINIGAHKEELKDYDTAKGTIRFLPGKPVPPALVKKLVKGRMAEIDAGAGGYATRRKKEKV
jgi:hypothetical protein